MLKWALILMIVFVGLVTTSVPASATVSVSFSDLGLIQQDLVIFYDNGSLFSDDYNTSSSFELSNNVSYVVLVKPRMIGLTESPGVFLGAVADNQSSIIGFILMVVFIYVLVGFLRSLFK